MENLSSLGVVLLAYLIGSIPFGWIFVKLKNGKDIRDVQSGRTGGTNAMRAAGLPSGRETLPVTGTLRVRRAVVDCANRL